MCADATSEASEPEETLLTTSSQSCRCPKPLCTTTDIQGVPCQKIFERAYIRAGYTESFARAVFVRFIGVEGPKILIPTIVRNYCARAKKMKDGHKRARAGFCLGCMINKAGWGGIVFAYASIHPEVTDKLLREHAEEKRLKTPKKQTIGLSEADQLWLDLIESGALAEDEGNLESRQPEDDFQ